MTSATIATDDLLALRYRPRRPWRSLRRAAVVAMRELLPSGGALLLSVAPRRMQVQARCGGQLLQKRLTHQWRQRLELNKETELLHLEVGVVNLVDPFMVGFAQASISSTFRRGTTLHDTIKQKGCYLYDSLTSESRRWFIRPEEVPKPQCARLECCGDRPQQENPGTSLDIGSPSGCSP